MGLIKKRTDHQPALAEAEPRETTQTVPAAADITSLEARYAKLGNEARRQLLKTVDMAPDALPFLIKQARQETDPLLQHSLFDRLTKLAHAGHEAQVVSAVIDLLKAGNATQRGRAVQLLSAFPETAGDHIPGLLQDTCADTRLYALDVIQHLVHPAVPEWLKRVLDHDEHPNVITSAIDRALEAGCTELQGSLDGVGLRFTDAPMVRFAVKLAKNRLSDINQ